MTARTPIQRTQDLGVDFWNDSCDLKELCQAVAQGAVGATSNPVIVGAALENDRETWLPVLEALIRKNPADSEDELAWKLIAEVAVRAAGLLAPVHKRSGGKKGFLSVQVNPKFYRDSRRMLEQGRQLSRLAENIAIKAPATAEGLKAIEELTASGIAVNATVSFTVPQALACAEAMERGLARAGKEVQPYVTLMVGRLDDHLKRVMAKDGVPIEPDYPDWAGIAVFKKAYALFKEKGYRSRLLVAAYRHSRHWSELIGEDVVQSIPYAWWTRFNRSDVPVSRTIDKPVESRILDGLYRSFPDFRKAYDEEGLNDEAFARYGASIHTLDQFLSGYSRVLEFVRGETFAHG